MKSKMMILFRLYKCQKWRWTPSSGDNKLWGIVSVGDLWLTQFKGRILSRFWLSDLWFYIYMHKLVLLMLYFDREMPRNLFICQHFLSTFLSTFFCYQYGHPFYRSKKDSFRSWIRLLSKSIFLLKRLHVERIFMESWRSEYNIDDVT